MGTTNSNFLPATTGLNLGSSPQRWNASLQDLDIAGDIIGSPTVTGTLTVADLNGILNAAQFPGADIGAQINAAITALGSAGGEVYIPAGAYTFTTSILLPRYVKLRGASAYGTVLTWASGSGWAVIISDSLAAGGYAPGGALEDLTLVGPGSATTAGAVYIGGSDGVAGSPSTSINPSGNFGDHFNINRVRIYKGAGGTAFKTGIQWGNNAWSNTISQSVISFCATGIFFPANPSVISNSGEDVSIINTSISNNTGIAIRVDAGNNIDLACAFCSIDFNGSWSIQNGTSVSQNAISLSDCYVTNADHWMQNYGTIFMSGCYFTDGSNSGVLGYLIDNENAANFTVVGGQFFNSGTGHITNDAGAVSSWYGVLATGPGANGGITSAIALLDRFGNFSGANAFLSGKMGTYNQIVTVSNGIPSEVAAISLTGQTAAIVTATLYAVPASGAGQYRLSWDTKVTTAAGVSSTLGALTIGYTDPDGVVISSTAAGNTGAGAIGTTQAGNTTASLMLGLPMLLNCKASTNITYAMAYASNAANAMAYNLHIILEAV